MRDEVASSEAMAGAGVDATHLLGAARIINMQDEPQRSAFSAYRVAFRDNAAEPNLRNAAALVRAWDAFADLMGLDHA